MDLDLYANVVSPLELSADEISEWRRFSVSDPNLTSPFLSYYFARAVAEAGVDVRVCVIQKEGVIRAFFPYQFSNKLARLTRAAERVGGEMSDYFGVIADPDFRVKPAQLLKLARLNYLTFSHLPDTQLQYGLTGEKPRVGLRIQLEEGLEHPLEQIKSVTNKYLKDSKKRERKLSEEVGPIAFEFDVSRDRQEILNKLIHQKRTQYKKTNVPDALGARWKQELLYRLSETQNSSCRGVLSAIFAGDHWIASHFGVMGNGCFHLWFPVYNPEFSKYAPGRLLLHHIVQESSTEAFRTIDRGEGDTPRKREVENEEYRLYRGVWKNLSGASLAIHNFQRLAWKLSK